MQKIGMLEAYVQLTETQDATFVHPEGIEDQSRLIKMRVRAEQPVNLYLVPVEYDYETESVTDHLDDPDFILFIAHVEAGLDQIEFYYRGSFCLRVMGGNIWLDTYDNTAFNVESASPESFARLWEREERDPRILEMERLARHNTMMMQQQMQAEMAAFRAQLEAKLVDSSKGAPAVSGGGNTAESAIVPPAGSGAEDSVVQPPVPGGE